jgi:hypothetical protein
MAKRSSWLPSTNDIIDRIAATPSSRNDRAAILAALSGELTQRLSKHAVSPRRHAVDRKRARWRPLCVWQATAAPE